MGNEISIDDFTRKSSGKIVSYEDYSSEYDFHPYSYYESDGEPNKRIGDIFYVQKGTVQSSKREEGSIHLYSFRHLANSFEYTHDCEALVFVFGAGGSLGKVHYTNGRKFVASDLCFILTPKDPKNTNLKYYYAYFNSRRKEIVQRLARGTNKKLLMILDFKTTLFLSLTKPNKTELDWL